MAVIIGRAPKPTNGLSGSSALPQFGRVELPLHPDFGLWITHKTADKIIAWVAQNKRITIGRSACAAGNYGRAPKPILGLSGSSALPQYGRVELPLHPDFGLWTTHKTAGKIIVWVAHK
jgi:hypothetical protein